LKVNGPFVNCSSIDARGDRFVVARPGQAFLTSWGEINRPDGEPWGLMFVRLNPVEDSFCGLSHESQNPMLQIWETGGWHSRWTEFGRVVYDPFGLIHDGLPNGYQYWDESTNQPVSRGETYPVKNGLNEWTIIGDLQVGQINAIEGIGVFDGSKLRLIRAGYSILVNVYRSGESVTISFIDNQSRGFIIQTTMGELRLLPEVQIAPAPPAPTPSPVPPPIEVPPVSVLNQFSTVEQIRAKYPTPLGPRHPEFLVEVALATGGKLLRKDSGTHVTLATGENVSQDIVVYGSTGVDILQDGEGIAKPVWGVKEEIFDASRLVSVSLGDDMGTPTGPVPIPGLPGPEVDMAAVTKAISEALTPLDERLNVIGLKVSEVAAQLEALLKAPAKTPQTIKVQSSRAFGHSHSVTFVV
jgi:hypothetical protein